MLRNFLIWLHTRIGRMITTEYPERLVTFYVSHPTIGDSPPFVPEVYKALHEMSSEWIRIQHYGLRSTLEDEVGYYTASNGVKIHWSASTMESNAR